MSLLIVTALSTSFLDSLNPSAIAQQMLLQAMLPKKRNIWYFIAGIGLANFALGLCIYYGLASTLHRLQTWFFAICRLPLSLLAILAGLVLLGVGMVQLIKTRAGSLDADTPKQPVSLSPLSLFTMGAVFCGVELTSALPYFGFLALLAQHQPPQIAALALILLYNFIYLLPLMLVYWGYQALSGSALLQKLEQIMGRIAAYLVPVLLLLLGGWLCWYSLSLGQWTVV
ncbi:MAG: GAP family protein [Candidatus Fournierella pullistercoris]|uniref:GAP family protein n=1 Tax=Candidatus Allofournierella pullistercoris TaxID=2838597 RepID=A0A948T2R2_9FIRM|nr:GAP family protein [Candidatus Fournierella pullistercoris]